MTTTPSKYAAPGAKHPRIEGVKTKPLRVIPDERGWLMEVLRADESELFTKFGQVYISATYPGVVKAWHFHHKQVDNFACLAGTIKLVLIDTRDGSPTTTVVQASSATGGLSAGALYAAAAPGVVDITAEGSSSGGSACTGLPCASCHTTRATALRRGAATLNVLRMAWTR